MSEEFEKPIKPVIISAETYKTVILFASRYANQSIPPEQWKEIYGILTGYSDEDFVHVEGAHALTFGHDTDVQLDARHYGFIEEIQEMLDNEGNDHYVVGWFHSHPGLSLFFSYIDLINQLGFQAKNDDAIGLVFDHSLLGKKMDEKIGNNILTKYETGFEIYRLTDVNLNPSSPDYDKNYHNVDYIVEGLNKYFFANVLAELSSLVSAGKPLQTAYRENYSLESRYKDVNEIENIDLISELDIKPSSENLVDIPLSNEVEFGIRTLFSDGQKAKENQKTVQYKEIAEKYIYEGNVAFNNKDTFTGIEKYRQGIENYKKVKDYDRVMDLLRTLAKLCVSNDHLVKTKEFVDQLLKISHKQNNKFYNGVADYFDGYILLKTGDNNVLKTALSKIRDAAILFEKDKDFAGAGMCFNKIGNIYQTRLENYDSACLFYQEAIKNYNKAINMTHPLRTSLWSKTELLVKKVIELRDLIEELIPNITNPSIKKKVLDDMESIDFNF